MATPFYDDAEFKNWQQKTKDNKKKYEQYLKRANKNNLLKQLPDLHETAFEKINCLDCAACCKNYSPRFKGPDVRRISKYLGMKETEFTFQYLQVDEDEDYVTKTKPCPFLANDNTCNIYDVRPSDCERFPYTNEDVIIKRQKITIKNAEFCPAVFYVLEHLK
jgi:uncharacterized protein